MANIGDCLHEVVNDERVVKVRAASAVLDDGYVVVANSLVSGTRDTYSATQAAAATDSNLAIVIGGDVYQDANGNRVDVTDPTDVTYPAGTNVRAYKPVANMKFKIDRNAVTTASQSAFVVGNYLNPTASSYLWTAATTITTNAKLVLQIEALENYSVGLENVTAAICRVVVGH